MKSWILCDDISYKQSKVPFDLEVLQKRAIRDTCFSDVFLSLPWAGLTVQRRGKRCQREKRVVCREFRPPLPFLWSLGNVLLTHPFVSTPVRQTFQTRKNTWISCEVHFLFLFYFIHGARPDVKIFTCSICFSSSSNVFIFFNEIIYNWSAITRAWSKQNRCFLFFSNFGGESNSKLIRIKEFQILFEGISVSPLHWSLVPHLFFNIVSLL